LSTNQRLTKSLAILKNEQSLDRKERESQLMLLRQVWSRRFELPRKTPKWVWDALYLVGLVSEEVSLELPKGWHHAPGVEVLWSVLLERYQLAEIYMNETGEQGFFFTHCPQKNGCVKVHRNNRVFELPLELTSTVMPGTTQIWLMADESVVELLCNKKIGGVSPDWADLQQPDSVARNPRTDPGRQELRPASPGKGNPCRLIPDRLARNGNDPGTRSS
jgi:hypothetical protein